VGRLLNWRKDWRGLFTRSRCDVDCCHGPMREVPCAFPCGSSFRVRFSPTRAGQPINLVRLPSSCSVATRLLNLVGSLLPIMRVRAVGPLRSLPINNVRWSANLT
jgi:hypothetical protein